MALPACLRAADQYYPQAKAEAARRLTELGWSQKKTANTLNVSQAMVSKYVGKPPEHDPIVQRLASELLEHLQGNRTDAEWCHVVQPLVGAATADMQDFLHAERLLLERSPDVMPKIGVNMALLVGNDVLAYPARMISAKGSWIRPLPPELGVEGHLGRCLRALHKANPRIRALANIRGGPELRKRVPNCTEQSEGEEGFIAATGPGVDAIHDPGGFGFEPCLYIGGETATHVANRIIAIEEQT
ncbi:MAG: thiamine-phosphate synthase family protein [Thermoplasmatota archaeon]